MDKLLKHTVDELKKYRKVAGIVLFGSRVKGKTKPISDIDIAVLIKNPDRSIESEVSGFSSNLLDVVNFHRLPLYIQFEVLKHSKPLFIRDRKYFAKVKLETMRDYLEMSYLYERMGRRVLS